MLVSVWQYSSDFCRNLEKTYNSVLNYIMIIVINVYSKLHDFRRRNKQTILATTSGSRNDTWVIWTALRTDGTSGMAFLLQNDMLALKETNEQHSIGHRATKTKIDVLRKKLRNDLLNESTATLLPRPTYIHRDARGPSIRVMSGCSWDFHYFWKANRSRLINLCIAEELSAAAAWEMIPVLSAAIN